MKNRDIALHLQDILIKHGMPSGHQWWIGWSNDSIDLQLNAPSARALIALLEVIDTLPETTALIDVCVDARRAIASLPKNSLGDEWDDVEFWPIRDELLSRLDAALAQFEPERREGEGDDVQD